MVGLDNEWANRKSSYGASAVITAFVFVNTVKKGREAVICYIENRIT